MEYVLFSILLLVSAFFSGSETSLFSIGKVMRLRLESSKSSTDRMVAKLVESPRRLLVAVLLGNEVTNVALSATAASITSHYLSERSLIEQALLSSTMVVPLLLLCGEITPKTIAAQRPEAMARFLARPLRFFSLVTSPLVWLLQRLTAFIARKLSGTKDEIGDASAELDESELRTLVDASAREGVIEEQEQTLIHNVLDFGDTMVRDIMRPWQDVFTLNEQTPVDEAISKVRINTYSRIPVWSSTPKNITGILFAKDILAIHWQVYPAQSLRRLKRRALFTLGRRPAAELLEELRARRTHMAVVVDEFGNPQGICTMEDLLEELFGPIIDAHPTSQDHQTGETR